jgi:hypothetical protein
VRDIRLYRIIRFSHAAALGEGSFLKGALIDKWFKLACAIVGGLIAVAALVIGIIG